MSEPRCETCRFWDGEPAENVDSEATCRRFPPTLNTTVVDLWAEDHCDGDVEAPHNAFAWVFPTVNADDWCGEHQPKQEDK